MIKASAVDVLLSGFDVLTALEQFSAGKADDLAVETQEGLLTLRLKVPVDGLPLTVPVELQFNVRGVGDMEVELGLTWSNLPLLPGALKELALKKAMDALPGRYEAGIYRLDLTELLDDMPVTFRVHQVRLTLDGICIRLQDLIYLPVDPDTPVTALVPVPSTEEAEIPEHQPYYAQLRLRVQQFAEQNAPTWVRPLLPWVLAVPDFFVLLVRLARDERVPTAAKILAGAAVAYLISPIDLIPDVIPIIGELDDVALAIFAIEQISRRVPPELLQEHWPGEGNILELVRAGMAVMSGALPGKMLVAIRRVLDRGRAV